MRHSNDVSVFTAHTLPAVKHFDDQGKLVVIDGDTDVETVRYEFGKAFDNLFFTKYGSQKLGLPSKGVFLNAFDLRYCIFKIK